jgi:hypothetical protein
MGVSALAGDFTQLLMRLRRIVTNNSPDAGCGIAASFSPRNTGRFVNCAVSQETAAQPPITCLNDRAIRHRVQEVRMHCGTTLPTSAGDHFRYFQGRDSSDPTRSQSLEVTLQMEG